MIRLRIALWSLLAVFAVSGLSAAAASAEGPYWHVGGSKLKQGSKGIKLQNKASLVLSSEPVENLKLVITCGRSIGEGTIDGQGETKQGQGKGTVTYEQCKVTTEPAGKCIVAEPIKTNQLKSHLVHETFQGSTEQNGELFEPSPNQQGAKGFTTIKLSECGVLNGSHEITGSVIADLVPSEIELVEGLLVFPTTPITKAKHEGQEITAGLKFGTAAATFSGVYGARLQSGEPFGAFQT